MLLQILVLAQVKTGIVLWVLLDMVLLDVSAVNSHFWKAIAKALQTVKQLEWLLDLAVWKISLSQESKDVDGDHAFWIYFWQILQCIQRYVARVGEVCKPILLLCIVRAHCQQFSWTLYYSFQYQDSAPHLYYYRGRDQLSAAAIVDLARAHLPRTEIANKQADS